MSGLVAVPSDEHLTGIYEVETLATCLSANGIPLRL
jgi:hypothetical protein